MQAQRELLAQHNAEGDTYFEDEPWHPQYELLQERLTVITENMDHYEAQKMDEEREFLSPVVAGQPRAPGDYAWDHWQQWAQADGVPLELAQLGRSIIREAYQHDWPDELKAECGWQDDGTAMIELARQQPDRARIRWQYLLESDGDFHWCD